MARLHRRSARRAERRFVVEGPQAVGEALADEAGLLELFVVPGAEPGLVATARARGTRVTTVSPAVLAALAETVTPQGVVGVAPLRDATLGALAGARLVVVLHEVSDPGNAGTVIRCADAAGADAVVLTAGSVDPHNGKCVRATAGSLFHLPVVTDVPLGEVLAACAAAGLQTCATSGNAPDADDLDDLLDDGALVPATAWVLGNEAAGLPTDVLAAADRRVTVPLHGRAESLNLAAAAAVCLYASARAHRRSS